MRYYPINLDIQHRKCLVVGGGAVGARKVATLLDCGALITVVSPRMTEGLKMLSRDKRISLKHKPYESRDMNGMFLVIGATDDEALNHRVYEDAKRLNLLCNIADQPDVCNFILPAIVNRGDLILAISTSGSSPAYAKQLRKELETQFGPEYGEFLKFMGKVRKRLLSEDHEPETSKPLFEQLISGNLLDLIKKKQEEAIDSLLEDTLGEGYSYKELMEAAD